MTESDFDEEFPRTTTALRRCSDAVFVFFCCYLMARYTAYSMNNALPEEEVIDSMYKASIVFAVACLVSLLILIKHRSDKMVMNVAIVLVTAILASVGFLSGIVGVQPMNAGFICALLVALSTMQIVASFAGLMGGIAGAIVTGKTIGVAHVATGILVGIGTGIIITVVVVLVAIIVGISVAYAMMAFFGHEFDSVLNAIFVGIPTSVCSGIGGGITLWFVDVLVLELLNGVSDIPDGVAGGAIFGLIIGFILGANIGFSACFAQQARRRREAEESVTATSQPES